jgi:hypothetical protein
MVLAASNTQIGNANRQRIPLMDQIGARSFFMSVAETLQSRHLTLDLSEVRQADPRNWCGVMFEQIIEKCQAPSEPLFGYDEGATGSGSWESSILRNQGFTNSAAHSPIVATYAIEESPRNRVFGGV